MAKALHPPQRVDGPVPGYCTVAEAACPDSKRAGGKPGLQESRLALLEHQQRAAPLAEVLGGVGRLLFRRRDHG